MTGQATICALGAGRMGQGIAHAFAYAGHPVQLVDLKPRDASESRALQNQALGEIRDELRFTMHSLMTLHTHRC